MEVFKLKEGTKLNIEQTAEDIRCMTVGGPLYIGDIPELERLVSDGNISRLILDNFSLSDGSKDEFQQVYNDYRRRMKSFDGCFLLIQKIVLNADRISSFIIERGMVFSSDQKTLVHIPESEEVVIPPGIETVGYGCCHYYENVCRLILCDTLKEIRDYAFDFIAVTHLSLPDSLTVLGEGAFQYADIEELRLSSHLKAIPDECFRCCPLEELKIPSSVESIGCGAFTGLWFGAALNPEGVKIPEGVKMIDWNSFLNLHRITLPASLEYIAPDFYYEECIDSPENPPYVIIHPDNQTYYSKDGVLYYRKNNKPVLNGHKNC